MGLDLRSLDHRYTRHLDLQRPDRASPRASSSPASTTGPASASGPSFHPTARTSADARERFRFESGAAYRAHMLNACVPDTSWWAGRPLSEGRNAHSTNTKEDFEDALDSDANWFEGDVRKEINSDKLEMRHDEGHESGDNLTLKEWLEKGKESGRGLKLDIKEMEHLDRILAEVKESGVPQERLMINVPGGDPAALQKIRTELPNAIIGINAPSGDDELTSEDVDQMLEDAKVGGPMTFVVRYDRLTDDAIRRLSEVAPISVWNSPSQGGVGEDDIPRIEADLRARGVEGIIDLRPSMSNLDKVGAVADGAKNKLRDWLT